MGSFIFARYAEGASPRKIADELNQQGVLSPRGRTWAHSAIYPHTKGVEMLANAIYNGRQVWEKLSGQKILYPDAVAAICALNLNG